VQVSITLLEPYGALYRNGELICLLPEVPDT
jgi:hypothetical protein